MHPDDLLTTPEAAEYLNVHPGTLRRWDAEGLITPKRLPGGRDRRWRRGDLDALLTRPKGPAKAQAGK